MQWVGTGNLTGGTMNRRDALAAMTTTVTGGLYASPTTRRVTGVCEGCRFYAQVQGQPDVGLCRRYAPQPLFSLWRTATTWPTVRATESCGEWDSSR